jgi:hypothetical protein
MHYEIVHFFLDIEVWALTVVKKQHFLDPIVLFLHH